MSVKVWVDGKLHQGNVGTGCCSDIAPASRTWPCSVRELLTCYLRPWSKSMVLQLFIRTPRTAADNTSLSSCHRFLAASNPSIDKPSRLCSSRLFPAGPRLSLPVLCPIPSHGRLLANRPAPCPAYAVTYSLMLLL